MTNVIFDKKLLFKALGRKLPDKLILEKVPMMGTPVEQVTDETITVEIMPNRTDMLSLQGFARALKAFLNIAPGMSVPKTVRGKSHVSIDNSVKVVRPFTACAIVRKLRLDDSRIKQIIELQEKLHGTYGRRRKRVALGIYPLEHIKLPITYEARSPGDIVFRPLDFEKAQPAMQILKDHPKGQDYAHLLYGAKAFPVFCDARGEIMSLVPIVNSAETGRVTPSTKEVFIEVSGHDFEVCHKALLIMCIALADMGGLIETIELRTGAKKIITPNFTPRKMTLNLANANKLLGTSLSQAQATAALRRMGYDVRAGTVLVPPYRTDILHEVDLIEDIAVGVGYESIQPTVPMMSTVGNLSREAAIEDKLRDIFVGLGFIEVKNFVLSSTTIQAVNVKQMKRPLEMENPLTADYSVLRQMILPGLLETFARNRHNEYPQLVFEIGPAWTPDEEPRLAFAMISEKNVGFTEGKQVLESLHRALGERFSVKPYEDRLFISGRAAVFPGGFFGEIHPEVLSNFELPFAVVAGEIRFREIID
jgi:phenylalanyl-tRNA synthetase beta chain